VGEEARRENHLSREALFGNRGHPAIYDEGGGKTRRIAGRATGRAGRKGLLCSRDDRGGKEERAGKDSPTVSRDRKDVGRAQNWNGKTEQKGDTR